MNRRTLLVCLIAGICSDALGQGASFREAAESINYTIRASHYHPAELPPYPVQSWFVSKLRAADAVLD